MSVPREQVRCSLRVTQRRGARKPETGEMRGFLEEDTAKGQALFFTGLTAPGRNRLLLIDSN